jgi:hypothetical protein
MIEKDWRKYVKGRFLSLVKEGGGVVVVKN